MFLAALTLGLGAVHSWVLAVAADRAPDDTSAVLGGLAFLRGALDDGAGERMQRLFPEGYFFSHVLYGLAWCELASDGRVSPDAALPEARWAAGLLHSPTGTAPFAADLEPRYGIFYAGWTLMLDVCVAAIDPLPPAAERSRVTTAAAEIADAVTATLDAGGSPYLEAYPGQAWPVDTVVALAALASAGSVTGDDHAELRRRWVAATAADLDPNTGLLPHRVDPATGAVLQRGRGSSQSLIQRFWPLVDPAGAAASYSRFREHFLTREFGIVAVREYPHGVDGSGDVDSGPLLFGVSVSATVVTIGAAQANGDESLAATLTNQVDTFGVPVTWRGERRYAGGVLPVGDAFVIWARATVPVVPPADYPPLRPWYPALLVVPWTLVLAAWLSLLLVVARRLTPGPPAG
jgi:hypothetical protein